MRPATTVRPSRCARQTRRVCSAPSRGSHSWCPSARCQRTRRTLPWSRPRSPIRVTPPIGRAAWQRRVHLPHCLGSPSVLQRCSWVAAARRGSPGPEPQPPRAPTALSVLLLALRQGHRASGPDGVRVPSRYARGGPSPLRGGRGAVIGVALGRFTSGRLHSGVRNVRLARIGRQLLRLHRDLPGTAFFILISHAAYGASAVPRTSHKEAASSARSRP
jgi:hypothetical protein